MEEMLDKDIIKKVIVESKNIIEVMHVVKMLSNYIPQPVAVLVTE